MIKISKWQCASCLDIEDADKMKIVWPEKALKLDVFTHEPDWFCNTCIKTFGLIDLPEYDKDKWFEEPQAFILLQPLVSP